MAKGEDGTYPMVAFDNIAYATREGTYYYTITEVPGDEFGMSYASEPMWVRVELKKDDENLTPKIYYGTREQVTQGEGTEYVYEEGENGSPATAIPFESTYTMSKAELKVAKEMAGDTYEGDDEFDFALEAADGAPMPETETVKAKAGETASFGTVAYTAPGAYYYAITEVVPDEPSQGLTYATEPVWARVDVNADLITRVSYGTKDEVEAGDADEADAALITNTYTERGSLRLTKVFEGEEIADEDKGGVIFTVAGPDDFSATKSYAEFDEDGSWTIEGLVPGEYSVSEENAEVDGYDVTTSFSVGDEEKQSVDVEAFATAEMTIANTYSKQTEPEPEPEPGPEPGPGPEVGAAMLKVSKSVTGDAYEGDADFDFELKGAKELLDLDIDMSAFGLETMPENTTVSVKAGATGSFGAITYSRPGTYYYTITEVMPGDGAKVEGMAYNTMPAIAVVTVAEDLSTSTAYYDSATAFAAAFAGTDDAFDEAARNAQSATIVNVYAKPGTKPGAKPGTSPGTNSGTNSTSGSNTGTSGTSGTTGSTTRTASTGGTGSTSGTTFTSKAGTPVTADPMSLSSVVVVAGAGLSTIIIGKRRRKR